MNEYRIIRWLCISISAIFESWYCGILAADWHLFNWKLFIVFQVVSLLMWVAGASYEHANRKATG